MESRDEVAEKVAALADAVLGVAAEVGDPALQRSAAEMFAFAACIGSTPLAASLLRTLCDAMARSPSASRWGGAGLLYHSQEARPPYTFLAGCCTGWERWHLP